MSANPRSSTDGPDEDPWSAFSYIVAGVVVYGLIGWGLDRWLGTTFLVAVGIVIGAGLGIFLVYNRFGTPSPSSGDRHDRESAKE